MAVARALVSSASDRWFTPPDLLAEISAFFGGSYFDPCPARVEGERVESGLWLPWQSPCFVNPPYGRAIGRWVGRAVSDAAVDELVLLVPARTDTAWFQPLWDLPALCFLRGRLRFSGAASGAGAPFPSVLAYRGARVQEFSVAFGRRGAVVGRIADERHPALWTV